MVYFRRALFLISLIMIPITSYIHATYEGPCHKATAYSVELDKADTLIFESMMRCKPNCDLQQFSDAVAAREVLYKAWADAAKECLE